MLKRDSCGAVALAGPERRRRLDGAKPIPTGQSAGGIHHPAQSGALSDIAHTLETAAPSAMPGCSCCGPSSNGNAGRLKAGDYRLKPRHEHAGGDGQTGARQTSL